MESHCCVTLIVVVLCLLSSNCKGQVTFSRDWNAGKRGIDNPDFQATVKSAASMYHLLLNQMRQLALCESKNDDLDGASAPIFGGRR